ncbi:MAG: PAS domain S-box protein [Candidatus Omnitrophota bacterium]
MKADPAKTGRQGHAKHLVDGKYSIKDLVDLEELRNLFQGFTDAMGFTIGFLSVPESKILIATGWRDICTKYHRNCPLAATRCRTSNARLVRHLKRPGQIVIEACENGLVDCATPIIIKGKKVAILATGQVLLRPPSILYFKKQAKLFGCNEAAYLRALKEVPVISEKKLKQATRFLGKLAHTIIRMGYLGLAEKERSEECNRTEKAFRASEAEKKLVLDNVPDLVVYQDTKNKIIWANASTAKAFGKTSKELEGATCYKIFHNLNRPCPGCPVNKSKKTGCFEQAGMVSPDGRYWTISASPIKDASGTVTGLVEVAVNTTEQKRAEEGLKKALSLERATLESTADGILVVDHNKGKIADFNERFARLWNIPDKIVQSRDDKKLLGHVLPQLKKPQHFLSKVAELYRHPKKDSFDVLEFNDGRVFERYSHPQLINGKPIGRVWSFRDVTERKKAEETLKETEERFRLVMNNSIDLVYRRNIQTGRYDFFSPAAKKVLGFSPKELLGEDLSFATSRIHPDDLKAVMNVLERAQAGKVKSGIVDYRCKHKNGSYRWLSDRFSIVNDAKGRPLYWVGVSRDITASKRAEEEILRTRFQHQQLVENAKDGIFSIDLKGRFLLTNPEFRAMLGYDEKEFKKLNILDTYPRDLRPNGEQRMERIRQGETLRFERPMKRKDGNLVFVEVIAWKTPEGIIQSFARDVSDRKRAEEALSENRRQLRQIIDTVPHMIFAKDKQGRFILVNRAVGMAYGKEPHQLIGKKRQDIHQVPEEARKFLEADRRVLATGRPVLVANEIFTDAMSRKHILQTIKIPFKMAGMGEECILGVSVDVTEQRKVEEFRNDIVRTVSHELRTPLSIEKEGISLLMDEMVGPVNAEQKEILGTVMRSIDRLARMITSLLDISSIETGKIQLMRKRTDLADLIKDVMFEFKKRAAEKEIDLSIDLPRHDVPVFADPDKITQVLTNLVDNAVKFTPERGTVKISMAVLKDTVECEVQDSGIGIASENLGKMFEKFQQFSRTAGPGEKGFGLGLSIAKGIMDLHGGQIWIKSELGKGTRLTFSLPLYQKEEVQKHEQEK